MCMQYANCLYGDKNSTLASEKPEIISCDSDSMVDPQSKLHALKVDVL